MRIGYENWEDVENIFVCFSLIVNDEINFFLGFIFFFLDLFLKSLFVFL